MINARLALASLRYHRVQTVLVVALLLLPTVPTTYWFTMRASSNVPPEEAVQRVYGPSAVRITQDEDSSIASLARDTERQRRALARLVGPLQPEPEVLADGAVSLQGRSVRTELVGLGVSLQPGRFVVDAGRMPTAESEIAISRSVAAALGVSVGGEVSSSAGQQLIVVGIVVRPSALDARLAVVVPTEVAALALPEGTPGTHQPSLVWHLPQQPPNDVLDALSNARWGVTLRTNDLAAAADTPFDTTSILLLAGSVVALLQLGLLCTGVLVAAQGGRAYESAILASLGATRRRRICIGGLQLGLAGLLAGVAGTCLGVAWARLTLTSFSARYNELWTSLRVPFLWLALLAVVTTAAGSLAGVFAAASVRADVVLGLTQQATPRTPQSWRLRHTLQLATAVLLVVVSD